MNLDKSNILVIDPHPIVRDGVVAVLSTSLAGAAIEGSCDFPDALARMADVHVDLVITDFQVQGETSLSFLKHVKAADHRTRCLILSAQDEIQVGYPCIKAGAAGFVSKSLPVSIIADAVRMVLSGNHYISERLSKALMNGRRTETNPSPGIHLTARELRIFTMLGQCMSVSTIAGKLGVSVKTVESHRENIKNKLGHHNAAQVTAAAVRWLDDFSITI